MSILAALALAGGGAPPQPASPAPLTTAIQKSRAAHPEAFVYAVDRDAHVDVDHALQKAAQSNKLVLLIMGANWCHDSRGLAGWLETPEFAAMMQSRYVPVYIDIGVPQDRRGRNLDIAKRFGINKVRTTPLVLILSPDGKRLNSIKDVVSWRNAASRSKENILSYFSGFHAKHETAAFTPS